MTLDARLISTSLGMGFVLLLASCAIAITTTKCGNSQRENKRESLSIIVVIFAFGLGGAELLGVELTGIALPLGLSLFIIVVEIRIWEIEPTDGTVEKCSAGTI